MEEKILAKLDRIEAKFDEVDFKFQHMERKMMIENEKLKAELEQRLEEMLEEKLDKILDEKLEEKLNKKLEEMKQELKQEILNHMFIFEQEYGRKLTIAFEELMSRSNRERIQDESIEDLKRMSGMYTAYAYNHEDRIHKLEIAK